MRSSPCPGGVSAAPTTKAIHHHLFQDVFAWAGQYRRVRISKDGSAFCYPENIEQEMRRLFASLREDRYLSARTEDAFAADAAAFLSMLNAIHPFREGNGRTQMTFLFALAARAGHPLDLDRMEPAAFLAAMVASFKDDDTALAQQIWQLVSKLG